MASEQNNADNVDNVNNNLNYVILECVEEGSKLRVKMKSSGYLIGSNCQFPRDLRVKGRMFKVPKEHVKLMTMRGKYFYSIKNKSIIEIIKNDNNDNDNDNEVNNLLLKNTKIFEDETISECSVCLCSEKDTVFIPSPVPEDIPTPTSSDESTDDLRMD
jgi:hypothetical protein